MKRLLSWTLCVQLILPLFLFSATSYEMVPLPPKSDHWISSARSVNKEGVTIGFIHDPATRKKLSVVFQDQRVLLPKPLETLRSSIKEINGLGEICGRYAIHENEVRAFFLDQEGNLFDLLPPSGHFSAASALNERGDVVGVGSTASGDKHALLWKHHSSPLDLGTLGGHFSEACSINGRGDIVGVSTNSRGERKAFLYSSEGNIEDLGDLGGGESPAFSINGKGDIVGYAKDEQGHRRAFLVTSQGQMEAISPPSVDALAYSINDRGEVVGVVFTEHGSRAFLWEREGGFSLLQELVNDPGEWKLYAAFGTNERGEIVGFGRWRDKLRAFKLVPQPINFDRLD